MDYLLGADDIGRLGALRFRNAAGEFMHTPQEGERGIPPLLELTEIIGAAHAVERGTETEIGSCLSSRARDIVGRHASEMHGS